MRRIDARRGTENAKALFLTEFELSCRKTTRGVLYPAPGWRSQPPSPWWGAGGNDPPPPLTRKLGKLEGRAIRRSTALSEPVRSQFGHFFAQVNIEVSRGHQRSNFRKMMVLSGMPAIISGTIIATPNKKKQKIALETLFH